MAQTILDPSLLDRAPHAAVFGALFGATTPIRPLDGLLAHARGYPARLREALRESFPAVAHVVGDDAFAALCARYTQASPPHEWNLNRAGSRFAAHVRDDREARAYPFLGDLAELEWRIVEAFHADESAPLDPNGLSDWSAEDWSSARLSFRPGTAVLASPWPIREIWTRRAVIDVALDRGADHLLVRRRDLEVRIDTLGAAEASLLRSLLGGAKLGDALEALAHADAAEDDVTRMFGRWTALGIVIRCERH